MKMEVSCNGRVARTCANLLMHNFVNFPRTLEAVLDTGRGTTIELNSTSNVNNRGPTWAQK